MNEVLNTIDARHSKRVYSGAPIADETLVTLCRAGLAAPSARNGRPWELIIVKDRETLNELSMIRPYWKMLSSAQAAIVVAGAEGRYLQQDCAAATENILLAAESLGLAACWLGLYPNMEAVESVSKVVGLPDGIPPVMVIALGVPAENAPVCARKIEENKIHFGRYEEKA